MPGAAIFLLALAMSFLPDAIALPRSAPPWRRSAAALATHVFSVATVFLLTLAVSARPLFAGFVAVSLTALLAVVSNAKHASLREPLVFTDLSLFSQLFRHPRMYLPFLSIANLLVLGSGVAVFVGVLLTVVLLARRSWGEATYVGLSVGALATSSYYLSVARATLLWFPLWLLLAELAARRPWVHTAYLVLATPLMAAAVLTFTAGRWVG